MNRIGHWRLIVGVVTVLLGVTVQKVFSGSGLNFRCDLNIVLYCPSTGICQPTAHCGINAYHKCITNSNFALCQSSPGVTCILHATGCEFEEWSPMCGAATGVIRTPLCYDECA